ncbi:MAG: hypothetical protein A2927_03240 [Candidatus Komeilibacteria bacterium RIFCSPLOWO2_01_FULL_45_10]|uniref:UDP-N-acetylglucosamine 1-carboxyvinyltransferase n=1 Tax=Candidatus Komeilibacteria bacterium RIFCSPLOWO2_01_FULL_45_10 TaxID=1798550 RepID=A0A1G2BL70_9BACT|nr:MAG: hypothetical protein A2927_03240 [Candidatus Komeilibacteria bacterium RIFCSPLOWO2_01_FULL_45_10]
MSYYLIQGQNKLRGEIKVNSTKNSTVAILAAALLNQGTTELFNFPDLEEAKRMMEILESLGVRFKRLGTRHLKIIPPKKINLAALNFQAANKTRSVLFLFGILMHYFKTFKLPKAGGCKLGLRTIAPYLYGLENFGLKISASAQYYLTKRIKKSPPREIVLYESGDTVTETMLMAAALTPREITIKYASANYQVQELCFLLEKLGVKIQGIGTTTLTVTGKKTINKNVSYELAEDPIEAMLFIALAATTASAITIKGCPIDFLELELLKLSKMGFKYQILKKYFSRNQKTRLVDLKTFPSRLKALADKIDSRPYPGLNIDNLPFFVPIATQASGSTLIHDWVYENRAVYYNELNRLGAQITLADPHRVYVTGPAKLVGAEMVCPPALRPAVIILIAMIASRGKSILRNIYSIDRGYENLPERLKKLGVKIKKVEE